MSGFLRNYPFSDSRARLVEGFAAYDGILNDTPGAPHRGIDYVLRLRGRYLPFDVHAMHAGRARQGCSRTWGKFVIVSAKDGDEYYDTLYAHLDAIPKTIPPLTASAPASILLPAGAYLGRAGTSGDTKGIPQLHIELHLLNDGQREKLDPYGVYDRASSGRYPQPGNTLAGLEHAWTTDVPATVPVPVLPPVR